MKVIVSGYVGSRVTGIGRSLVSWINEIKQDDIEFVVYTNYDMEHNLKFVNNNVVVKTYKISCKNSIGNLLWTTFILPIMAIKNHVEVTLITNFTLLLFPVKPTVIFLHDMTEYKIPEKQTKLRVFYRTKLAIPISARNASKIITVSHNSQEDIIDILGIEENKIGFVYNGVDREKFHKIDKQKAIDILNNQKLTTGFILYVGTIDHPGRNLINLVKAYEKLRSQHTYGNPLVLVGKDGKGAELVKDYIKNSKYHNDIICMGYVTDVELLALYSVCDVFCYLSLYEGFGMPPVEALSCGAKVVVSNTSSLPEAVGDVGFIVNPNDIQEISNIILKAINFTSDENYRNRVDKHLEKFSWPSEGKKLYEILKLFKVR